MCYIKLGVLESFRVKFFSAKVVDSLDRLQIMVCLTQQHQKQPQKFYFGVTQISINQPTDIHRLLLLVIFPDQEMEEEDTAGRRRKSQQQQNAYCKQS